MPHATHNDIINGNIQERPFWLNAIADAYSFAAAAKAAVTEATATAIRSTDRDTILIQRRLAAIEMRCKATVAVLRRVPRPPRRERRQHSQQQRAELLANTTHTVVRDGGQWRCLRCRHAVRPFGLANWHKAGPCPGPPAAAVARPALLSVRQGLNIQGTHPSRRVTVHRGTVMCMRCGKWCTRHSGLNKPQPTATGKATLSTWNKGRFPNPRGNWPR